MSTTAAADTNPQRPFKCSFSIPACTIHSSFYEYRPSLALNALLLGIFAASLIAHTIQGNYYRTWTFMIGTVLGCLAEVLGYIGRIMSHNDPWSMDPFLIQIICLTLAPAFMAAAIYLCLSRIVTIFGPSLSRIQPVNYTRLFIACDFISLVLQGGGGGVASVRSQNYEDPALGNNIMIAGLAFQVATITLFMALCADFAYRVWKNGGGEDGVGNEFVGLRSSRRFKIFLGALALETIVIQVRSIFRLIEMSQGWSGPLQKNQTLFFVLEGIMIVIAILAMNVCHPGYAMREAYFVAKKVKHGKGEKDLGSGRSSEVELMNRLGGK